MTEEDDRMLDRVLGREDAHAEKISVFGRGRATALHATSEESELDGEQFDREERAALRRVAGLSTELEDVTEVEYRQLRLENVVLIGVYSSSGTVSTKRNRTYLRMWCHAIRRGKGQRSGVICLLLGGPAAAHRRLLLQSSRAEITEILHTACYSFTRVDI